MGLTSLGRIPNQLVRKESINGRPVRRARHGGKLHAGSSYGIFLIHSVCAPSDVSGFVLTIFPSQIPSPPTPALFFNMTHNQNPEDWRVSAYPSHKNWCGLLFNFLHGSGKATLVPGVDFGLYMCMYQMNRACQSPERFPFCFPHQTE